MGACPALLKFLAHAFGDQMHRQSGRIGRHNRAWLAVLRHTRKQLAFDLQVFGDDFDDPVGLRAAREVVFKIANGHALRERGGEKCRGLCLFRRFQPRAYNLVALGSGRIRGQIWRDDVQQNAGESGIGKMRGDARTHSSGAQNYSFFNPMFHGCSFQKTRWQDRLQNRHVLVKPGASGPEWH